MNVLIGCEFSQIVTDAFLKMGHNAYSCDILRCEGKHPERHLQMDIYKAIDYMEWDIIGLHPPCTKMALSGNRSYAKGKPKHNERVIAIDWTISLWIHACSRAKYVYMENPLGVMNGDGRLPKPQFIQQYYFGDPIPKKTCLWLQNLPDLFWSTNDKYVEPQYLIYNSRKNKSGKSKYSIFGKMGKGSGHKRSVFFLGIAHAMAEQWGNLKTK